MLLRMRVVSRQIASGRRYIASVRADPREDAAIYVTDPIDPKEKQFGKILIANRGEIACRIMKTARAMGIKTVAVHSDVDSSALHVRMADEAVCVGEAPTKDSYLRIDRILEAVKSTGAEAVHPGYGFLSENTLFAAELEKVGVKFIGPHSKAILDLGDKIHSKKIAAAAKVNLIPGFDGDIKDENQCIQVANEIGYPVMIKASAGGGGKGMRIAWNDKEARESFRLSKQEAAAYFGDDRMLVEKYIDNPRHIEMQVLCDKHGNALWLNERECSIQRRNQKVIEEAPSPFLTPEMRAKMGEQTVQLAKAVGYDSAGTVEFLVDSKRNFYFLEMNTRLQVEHPITECITGIDLVQQMIRVAYGHKLKIQQKDVPIRGWAVESRVYAEDPYKGFGLPSVGRLTRYVDPRALPGVRCDTGVGEGSEISIYYDPLICKLVTRGENRTQALDRMTNALDNYVIRGLTHNIPLLRDIVEEKRFRSGNISTKYLPETYPHGFAGATLSAEEGRSLLAVATLIRSVYESNAYETHGKKPKSTTHDWIAALPVHGDGERPKFEQSTVKIAQQGGKAEARVAEGGQTLSLDWTPDENGRLNLASPLLTVNVGGGSGTIVLQLVGIGPTHVTLVYKGTTFKIAVHRAEAGPLLQHIKEKPRLDLSSTVVAPMPGAIKSVAVKAGDAVAEGQELVVIEAMKMQNSLHAARSGKVKAVHVKAGETVDDGQTLVELE